MTENSRLMVHEVDEIGSHYAETLRHWRASFRTPIGEAAFRTRALRDVQLTLTRPFSEALT